jgi:hypothetical protein
MLFGPGTTTLDWGDADERVIDPGVGGYTMAYATHSVLLPNRVTVYNLFFTEEDGYNSTGRVYQAGFYATGLPTADPDLEWNGWVVTFNLDPTGYNFTMTGSDLDGDELIDFGYVYWFTDFVSNNPLYPDDYMGPVIAGDPTEPGSTCTGCQNVFDKFADPDLDDYLGPYWFGGSPFAQFYMELFEHVPNMPCPSPGFAGKYCFADIDCDEHPCDCVVGLEDLQKLLGNYGMTTGATHADGDLEPAPPDGDGDVDLADLQELLSQYGDDCN